MYNSREKQKNALLLIGMKNFGDSKDINKNVLSVTRPRGGLAVQKESNFANVQGLVLLCGNLERKDTKIKT